MPVQRLMSPAAARQYQTKHIPLLHLIRRQMIHHTPIIIIPPHLYQLPTRRVVSEHWIPRLRIRCVQGARLARRVRRDGDAREEGMRVGVEFFHDGGGVEAVDEEGLAACAVCVGEEVEELEAAGVGLRKVMEMTDRSNVRFGKRLTK